MSYPLGSFPRFAHQDKWASERRARASHNSAVTRQIEARRHLNAEIKACGKLQELIDDFTAGNPEGEQVIQGLRRRVDRIKSHHQQGERIYYAYLGETLRRISLYHPHISKVRNLSKDELEFVVMQLGELKSYGEEIVEQAKLIKKNNPHLLQPSPPSLHEEIMEWLDKHGHILFGFLFWFFLIGLPSSCSR